VHAILDLETMRLMTKENQTFKERTVESSGDGSLGQDNGTQLAVIADEDELLGAGDDGNKTLRLGSLRRLVDDHTLEADTLETEITCAGTGSTDHVGLG
jgi:hypothetical protein